MDHGAHAPVHGMVIVGERTVYLSHLPMFDDPHHRFQVILEASFRNGGDPQGAYARDRAESKARRYTLEPRRQTLPDLTELVSSDPARPPRGSFQGTIFRGHFEQSDRHVVVPGVTVHVARVVHFRELDPRAPGLPRLEYILFGKGDEVFLDHLITRPPDFGQIVPVRIIGHAFTDEELGRGLHVVIPDRANRMLDRLMGGQRVAGEVRLSEGSTPEVMSVELDVAPELHFEEGDLRSPSTLDPTPEEIRAGF
jgi:hypothetical protein